MEKRVAKSKSKKSLKKQKSTLKMELSGNELIKVEMTDVIEVKYEWKIPNFTLDQRYFQKFDLPYGFGTV